MSQKTKVSAVAYDNPIYDSDNDKGQRDDQHKPLQPHRHQTAIHVRPAKNDDLKEVGLVLIQHNNWDFWLEHHNLMQCLCLAGFSNPLVTMQITCRA